jgi:hypothetical protein
MHKIMLEVRKEADGLIVVKRDDCPDELADFLEGCLEWLRKYGAVVLDRPARAN